jgi:hypothetical protein
MAQDHNDIYSIVERLRILEEGLSPAVPKIKGLNSQQKSVNQLGAMFKPKTVAVLTSKTDPKNPMAGKLVGGCEEAEELNEEPLEEAITSEDVLDKVKQSFADYLKNVANEIKIDTDLKDKKKGDSDLKKKDKKDRTLIAKVVDEGPEEDEEEWYNANGRPDEGGCYDAGGHYHAEREVDMDAGYDEYKERQWTEESAPVKTLTNECGIWEMHGNERDGFEVRRAGRCLPTRFKNLDEAEMALEMFAHRMRKQDESQDYIDEA